MLERYTIKVIIMFHSNFSTNLVVFSQIIDSFLIHNQPKYISTSLVMTNVYNLKHECSTHAGTSTLSAHCRHLKHKAL